MTHMQRIVYLDVTINMSIEWSVELHSVISRWMVESCEPRGVDYLSAEKVRNGMDRMVHLLSHLKAQVSLYKSDVANGYGDRFGGYRVKNMKSTHRELESIFNDFVVDDVKRVYSRLTDLHKMVLNIEDCLANINTPKVPSEDAEAK